MCQTSTLWPILGIFIQKVLECKYQLQINLIDLLDIKRPKKVIKMPLRGFSALGCQKGLSDQSQNLAMSFGYVFLHEKLGYRSASCTQISPIHSPEFLLKAE